MDNSKRKIKVLKYGGTSIGKKALFDRAVEYVSSIAGTDSKVVLIVSAQAQITDSYIKKMKDWASNATPREVDAYVSIGEMQSAALMAGCLTSNGIRALSLNPHKVGFRVTSHFKNAKIQSLDVDALLSLFEHYDVLVIPGFQGVTEDSSIATLGRGGSDTSAVAVAAAIGVDLCTILTDVPGVFSADPNMLPNSKPILLQEVGYSEVCEMSALGVQVIHPRAVEIAAKHGLLIKICSAEDPNSNQHTIIGPFRGSPRQPVKACCLDEDVALLTVSSLKDLSADIISMLHVLFSNNIPINILVHHIATICSPKVDLVLPADYVAQAAKIIQDTPDMMHLSLNIQQDVALLSIVGGAMKHIAGTAADFLKLFDLLSINIRFLSSTSLSQSALMAKDDALRAFPEVCMRFKLCESSNGKVTILG